MKNKVKVSIIIPAYNAEKYINRCLDSILKQTFKEWDCHVVCNGCTDKTYLMAKSFKNIDKRFKVYNFEKKGLCFARNKGIEFSTGEYITFIDIDDYVSPTMIEQLYSNKNKCDIIYGNIVGYMNNSKMYFRVKAMERKYNINENILFSSLSYDFGHVLNNLYKRSAIDDIRFHEDITNNEDLLFNMEVIMKNKEIYHIQSNDYHYIYYYNTSNKYANIDYNLFLEKYYELERKYGKNKVFKTFVFDLIQRKTITDR